MSGRPQETNCATSSVGPSHLAIGTARSRLHPVRIAASDGLRCSLLLQSTYLKRSWPLSGDSPAIPRKNGSLSSSKTAHTLAVMPNIWHVDTNQFGRMRSVQRLSWTQYELSHSELQRRALYSKPCSGSIRTRKDPVRLLQHGQDVLSFDLFKSRISIRVSIYVAVSHR